MLWNVNRKEVIDGVSIRVGSDDLEWPWKAGREESNFWGRSCYIAWRSSTKFGRITQLERGAFLAGQPRPYRKGAGPQRSPILGILLCLCLHPLTQNDQIRHGDTYGRGVFSGGQPRHCVCRNVSPGLSAIAEFHVMHAYSLCQVDDKVWCTCLSNACSDGQKLTKKLLTKSLTKFFSENDSLTKTKRLVKMIV